MAEGWQRQRLWEPACQTQKARLLVVGPSNLLQQALGNCVILQSLRGTELCLCDPGRALTLSGPGICCPSWSGSIGGKQDALDTSGRDCLPVEITGYEWASFWKLCQGLRLSVPGERQEPTACWELSTVRNPELGRVGKLGRDLQGSAGCRVCPPGMSCLGLMGAGPCLWSPGPTTALGPWGLHHWGPSSSAPS